jgi:branched-chain amino acid aminotransferase
MRQSGVLAAAGLHVLDDDGLPATMEAIARSHALARTLSDALAELPHVSDPYDTAVPFDPTTTRTNIVRFGVADTLPGGRDTVIDALDAAGVGALRYGAGIRMVTHRHRDEASVSVFDSAFLVGDGIWEGIRLHHGRFAFLDLHLDRLFDGLEAVSIDPPWDREGVTSLLHEVVERNEMHESAHVRLMVSRGRKKTPSQHPANLVSGPTVVVIAEHKQANPEVAARGVALRTVSVRRPPPDTLDQRLNCHSKLHEVVALVEATEQGADEALMLDTDGHVATCNATNFFAVIDGTVTTSAATHNLPGITRHVVLREATAAGLPVHAGPFTPEDLDRAQEAFVTGTFGGITPVRELDGRQLEVPGPMTSQLQRLYAAALEAEAGTPSDDERPRA